MEKENIIGYHQEWFNMRLLYLFKGLSFGGELLWTRIQFENGGWCTINFF